MDERLTDNDLSRLVSLLCIHEGKSSQLDKDTANRLRDADLIEIVDDGDDVFGPTRAWAAKPEARNVVKAMLNAGRRAIVDSDENILDTMS